MGLLSRLLGKFYGPPTQDQFAKLLMDGIRQAGETREIVYDQSQFRLFVENQTDRDMFLADLYAWYCSAPKEAREAWLRGAIRGWFLGNRSQGGEEGDRSMFSANGCLAKGR
jgi:hypothetical protein